ncbi:MAG: hypothetical protein FWC80_03400 [Firmicutes bacterium]|nr:hypothetical protein [Bacillota bacterium]
MQNILPLIIILAVIFFVVLPIMCVAYVIIATIRENKSEKTIGTFLEQYKRLSEKERE